MVPEPRTLSGDSPAQEAGELLSRPKVRAVFWLGQRRRFQRSSVQDVALARLEAVEAEVVEHLAQDHRAGDDHRSPVGIECRELAALGERERCEALELPQHAFAREAVT